MYLKVVPHASQSNPCERANQTITKLMKTMVKDSGLPHVMWMEAAQRTAYVKNRVPSKGASGSTPFKKYYGRKPTWTIYELGSLGHVYIDREIVKRWTIPHSSDLCGYSDQNAGYKMYFPDSRTIKFAPDMRINEKTKYIQYIQNIDSARE